MPIRRETFLTLYEKIEARLRKHDPPILIRRANGGQDTVSLGLTWRPIGGEDAPNAACIILRALEEARHLPRGANLHFGRLLYHKYRETQRNPGMAFINIREEAYVEGLLKYLGYNSLEEFERQCVVPEPSRWPQDWSPAEGDGFVYYIGTHFSFRSYRINKFLVGIRYSGVPGESMDCWVWGFHTSEQVHEGRRASHGMPNSPVLTGTAVVRGRYLHIQVNAEPPTSPFPLRLSIMGLCEDLMGHFSPEQNLVPCTLQTISLLGYLIALEAYLVRCTPEEARSLKTDPAVYRSNQLGIRAVKPEEEQCLYLYYMLQRRNFRVKELDVFHLSDLQYRSDPVSDYIHGLAGTYRIWNLGLRRGVVVQSKLVISQEVPFRTLYYPYISNEVRGAQEAREQVAVINISNPVHLINYLIFTAYVRHRLSLVSTAIFSMQEMSTRGWAEGVFASRGYDEKGVIGGYAVMCKVKEGEECEPRKMEREEAEQYAASLGITDMYNGLRQLWKHKLWKPKTNTRLGCYGVLRRSDGAILMVSRIDGPFQSTFDLPGGLIEFGETPEQAVYRLFEQETGYSVKNVRLMCNLSHHLPEWLRKDGVKERTHSIALIYEVQTDSPLEEPLYPYLAWIRPNNPTAPLSPFAARLLNGA